MKVIIGYPPLKSEKGFPLLSQNRQFQWFTNPSILFPVIPASAATLLESKGFEVIWKDALAENINKKEFMDFLEKEKPNLFAFETKTPVIKQHWRFINELKKKFPKVDVVIMGDHVTAFPDESLRKSKADFVITGGDYDFSLLGLCNFLTKKGKMPGGIYYRKGKKIKNTGNFVLNHSLNELPFIDRELTKWWLYQKEFNIKGKPFMYIMSGRDCPWHKCRFCSWTTLFPKFRVRSPENVLDEIEMLVNKYGVKEIFDDSGTFPANPPGIWLKEFCEGMIKRGLNKKIAFSCNMRVDYLTKENAALMAKAGFRLLKVGLESANQRTLDKINKGIKVQQIIDACKNAKSVGLTIHLTMIVGYPWETKQEALKTFNLAKQLMLKGYADVLQATVLVPYPGTPLWKEAKAKGQFRFSPYNYERYDMTEPVLKTKFPSSEVMGICDSIYSEIFFSPIYIARRLVEIRSLTDIGFLLNGAKAVWGHIRDFARR